MMTSIVIVGCGGHGRETLSIINALNTTHSHRQWQVLGFVDDDPSRDDRQRLQCLDLPWLGRIEWLSHSDRATRVVLGIGDPRARRAVGERIEPYGLPAANLVHPAATIGPDTVIGDGLLAFAGARVTTNVTLGRHVHLNQNSTVGHDCVLDDYASVNPLAAVSGGCHVGTAALIGTTAAVLQGRRIGAGAIVGAGACVVRDVPAHSVVKGVPAQ